MVLEHLKGSSPGKNNRLVHLRLKNLFLIDVAMIHGAYIDMVMTYDISNRLCQIPQGREKKKKKKKSCCSIMESRKWGRVKDQPAISIKALWSTKVTEKKKSFSFSHFLRL